MNVQKALILIVLSLAACTPNSKGLPTAVSHSKDSIIGGVKASASDTVTASTVSLIGYYKGTLMSFCTGTLISRNLILTAAHCLANGDENFSVYFGAVLPKKAKSANLLKSSKWIIHPGFDVVSDEEGRPITTKNDVALIKLESEIPFFAKPVPVLDENISLAVGDILLLAGYGLVNEIEQSQMAKGLNYVRVPVAKMFESIIVTDQTNAKGACAGDSGGPAYLETSNGLVVVGATRGPHERVEDCRHYGEYTNAPMFKSFLVEQAKLMDAEEPQFTSERN